MQSVRGFEYGVIHCRPDQDIELSCFINNHLEGFSLSAEELLEFGAVYVNQKRVTKNIPITSLDHIRIHRKPRRFYSPHTDWQERIAYENEHLIILNKPSGIPCHATVDNIKENLLSLLEIDTGKKYYITHRLDIPTQGLLILAKNQAAQTQINKAFAERKIRKTYVAHSRPREVALGLHEHYMIKSPRAPKVVLDKKEDNTEICQLFIHQTNKFEYYYEHRIELCTGRTHQIRAQMAHMGSPLIGDTLYKGPEWEHENAIALWSCELEFSENDFIKEAKISLQPSDEGSYTLK